MKALLAPVLFLFAFAGAINGWASQPASRGAAPATSSIPDTVLLDNVPGCYGSVRFDHRLHVQMSTIKDDCRACHHELAPDSRITGPVSPRACRDCHEPLSVAITDDKPGLRGAYHRQCLSCHKDWALQNGCGFCHTPSSKLRDGGGLAHPSAPRSAANSTYVYNTGHRALPVVTFHHDDHTQRFGLACAACHTGTSCGQCHGPATERPLVSRQQSCYTCHAETRCITCHDLQERGRFDHSVRTGWYLRPGHASLPCEACHIAGSMPTRPGAESCRPCHARRWGDADFDHSRSGVALCGDHAYFDCLECHRGGDERMVASCSACHTDRPVNGKRRVGRDLTDWLDR